MRILAGLLAPFVGLFLTSVALAEVKEPNGVSVPLASTNGETQLSTLFTDNAETIDFVADGFATPDTFSPLCGFKATLVLKQSGSSLAVGWYNADPARTAAPAVSEIHEIVPAGSAVGTAITGADVRNSPDYAGGAIGFALIRTPPNFSEARYNTVYTLSSPPAPWVLSVSYASTTKTNAYYVGFEDGNTTAVGWSNDGDFNDYVFLFEGLSCVGAGAACEVAGAKGVCVPGLEECSAAGELVCKPINAMSDEVCDAQDNDCDGKSDEGDTLCGDKKVCSRGQCVPRCGSGEFRCAVAPFTQCENGLCIDPACAGKSCGEGQACVAGECRAPCDGVVCPKGQACRLGACVDPCAGVSCDGEHVCSGGACILRCDCAGCEAPLECAASGLCVAAGCAAATCAAGTVCEAGTCVDACEGAACPNGGMCEAGTCQAGSEGAAGAGSAGSMASVAAGSGGTGAEAGAGGSNAEAGAGGTGSAAGRREPEAASGCGCQLAAAREASLEAWATSLALALAFAARRRRRLTKRS